MIYYALLNIFKGVNSFLPNKKLRESIAKTGNFQQQKVCEGNPKLVHKQVVRRFLRAFNENSAL